MFLRKFDRFKEPLNFCLFSVWNKSLSIFIWSIRIVCQRGQYFDNFSMSTNQTKKQWIICYFLLLLLGASNYTQSEKSNVQENARKLGAQLQNAGNDEHEILEVLNSISKGSLPQPSLLTHFVQELSNLISHESKNVRNQAYDLFLKLLRHDPTISHQLMVPYLGCLETNDPAIGKLVITNYY